MAKSGFTAAFALIFVSELGDKTFFIAAYWRCVSVDCACSRARRGVGGDAVISVPSGGVSKFTVLSRADAPHRRVRRRRYVGVFWRQHAQGRVGHGSQRRDAEEHGELAEAPRSCVNPRACRNDPRVSQR